MLPGKETEAEGEMEQVIQRHLLSCVYMGKCTHLHKPSSHQRFIIKEEDKSPSVSSSNKMVNALDCENVNVSTKLGNKEYQ